MIDTKLKDELFEIYKKYPEYTFLTIIDDLNSDDIIFCATYGNCLLCQHELLGEFIEEKNIKHLDEVMGLNSSKIN